MLCPVCFAEAALSKVQVRSISTSPTFSIKACEIEDMSMPRELSNKATVHGMHKVDSEADRICDGALMLPIAGSIALSRLAICSCFALGDYDGVTLWMRGPKHARGASNFTSELPVAAWMVPFSAAPSMEWVVSEISIDVPGALNAKVPNLIIHLPSLVLKSDAVKFVKDGVLQLTRPLLHTELPDKTRRGSGACKVTDLAGDLVRADSLTASHHVFSLFCCIMRCTRLVQLAIVVQCFATL